MRTLVLLYLVGMVSYVGLSQDARPVYLNNQTVDPTPIATHARTTITWPTNNCQGGKCFAILHFEEMPGPAEKAELLNLGIQLYEPIPDWSFLASADESFAGQLPDFVTSIIEIEPIHKRPIIPLSTQTGAEGEEEYHLVGVPFPGVATPILVQKLTELGGSIMSFDSLQVRFKLSAELLPDLLNHPFLQYTESIPPPPIPEGRWGRTNGRVQRLNNGADSGYSGAGVSMAIADDGPIDHIDFHGRVTDWTQFNTGDHGDMTAGMAMGGGILDPLAMGMAPSAYLYLYDISNYGHINNAVANYNQHGIVITSTSYGEGCGDSYNLSTQGIDGQVYNHNRVLHFFSAGNHGLDPCLNEYGWLGPSPMGFFYSTITGGRKAGKNVLAIGNNEYDDDLRLSSSRGPTPDGRIKPDLTAMGQGDLTTNSNNNFRLSSGTSAAAPNAGGAAAGLYEYYREANGGQDPFSDLIKAVMLNGAEDLGLPGPDFSYGWGRLHAGRSLEMLSEGHYLESTISHNQQQAFTLTIPAGTQRVKVMLYWHDPAGSPLASKALVNDLDMTIVSPTGNVSLPWTPSYAPDLNTLGNPAQAQVDRVNNAEQIVLENPAAGTYSIQVAGYQVPLGPQRFVVVYHVEDRPIDVVFPFAGATLVPQEENVIQWDAIGNSGNFTIEFSTNGGGNWQPIANNVPGNLRQWLWTTPSLISDQVLVRVSRAGQVAVSDGPAVIIGAPEFTVSYLNDFQAQVNWTGLSGAVGYEILRLGEEQLEVVGASPGLQFVLPAELGETYWITVRAIMPSGQRGRRANAQPYQHYTCDQNYQLTLQFDQYPNETRWYVLNNDGDILLQGGPYEGFAPFSQVTESFCLPGGCFNLVVTDAYGDGMCCNNGQGWFVLQSAQGNTLATDSDFGNSSVNSFCEDISLSPLTIEVTHIQDVSCFAGQDGSASVTATGGTGAYTYQWSTGGTGPGLQYLTAGTYTVTVSDGEQTVTTQVVINQPQPLQLITSSTPSYCQNGTLTVVPQGGTPPYQITWPDGNWGFTRQELAPGTYFPIVIDANGCVQTASVNVGQGAPIAVQLVLSNPSCFGGHDGQIQAIATGGYGSYSYQWNNGQQTSAAIGLAGGNYQVTVSDAGGCQTIAAATLTMPVGLVVSAEYDHNSCAESMDGSLNLTTSGGAPPYTYQWSDGGSGPNRAGLIAGPYQVTVTDANGCFNVRALQLIAPAPIQVQSTITTATPTEGGSISLSIYGGSPPYIIAWDNGAYGPNLSNLLTGTYQAVVTDSRGCTAYHLVTVPFYDPNPPPVGSPDYCGAQGSSTTYEWIESIKVDETLYPSGNDAGYGDYTAITIPMGIGQSVDMELSPGYFSTPYNEYWRVWIDFNQDGDFNDVGEVVVNTSGVAYTAEVSFVVPPSTLTGTTQMRVAMQYGVAPVLCSNLTYGEVEDYTIEFSGGEAEWDNFQAFSGTDHSLWQKEWKAYPNPVRQMTVVAGWMEQESWLYLDILDKQGRIVRQEKHWASTGEMRLNLSMEDLRPGVYNIRLRTGDQVKTIRVVRI